jgi:hypothetical protein
VPAHDGVRRDDLDRAPPRSPHLGQADPDESIDAPEAQTSRGLLSQDRELVAQRKDLRGQRRPRTDSRPKSCQQGDEKRDHRDRKAYRSVHQRAIKIRRFEFSVGTTPAC